VAGTSTDGLLSVKDNETACQMKIKLSGAGEIRSIAEDNAGQLWIVAENGVYCYDGRRVRQYMNDGDGMKFYCVCTDMSGNVYVGTANRGLFRKLGEQFLHVAETGNTPIPALYPDHTGNILVGFDGKGISIYNPLTGELTANSYYSHEVELSKSKVYAIIEDSKENVWLGLSEKGIFQQPPSSSGFRYMGHKAGAKNVIGTSNICCVYVDSKANTWLGTDKDGIYCLDKDGRLVRHYSEGTPSTVLTIDEDEEGRIWIGSYGEGGGWIDPQTSHYHPVNSRQNNFLSITDYAIDRKGRVWAGTMGQGLLMFTKGGQEIQQYRSADGTGKGLSHDYISQLSLSPDGHRLYVAADNGLNCLDLDNLTWNSIFGDKCLLPGANVNMAREINNRLWIGTTEGLFHYDLRKRELGHYTVEHGLPSNNVASI
jgi:ligand-binding sensor domain-containing protein